VPGVVRVIEEASGDAEEEGMKMIASLFVPAVLRALDARRSLAR
jgi:hypothetical protein